MEMRGIDGKRKSFFCLLVPDDATYFQETWFKLFLYHFFNGPESPRPNNVSLLKLSSLHEARRYQNKAISFLTFQNTKRRTNVIL